MKQRVATVLDRLRTFVEAEDYAGYDPYDALNSPLLRRLTASSKWARLLVTQLLRRLPLNARPLLGVPKGHNPKALGLFLWGYGRLLALNGDGETTTRLENLVTLLEANVCRGYRGACWGYNFDWQSRTVFRPAGTPTVVNTAFIGHALLDVYAVTGWRRLRNLACATADFLCEDLNRTAGAQGHCLSYTPIDRETVHNANLLGASLLARLHEICPSDRIADCVRGAVAYSLAAQRPDGSWPYAETRIQQWTDSFHTGFVLQALHRVQQTSFGSERVEAALQRGMSFYRARFFDADGRPHYYADRVYPLDIHCPAQAIVVFSEAGPETGPWADRVLNWTLGHLYDERRGWFWYRRGRWGVNRICYMRWAQAWMWHALSCWLTVNSERVCHDTRTSDSGVPDPGGSGDLLQLPGGGRRGGRPVHSGA